MRPFLIIVTLLSLPVLMLAAGCSEDPVIPQQVVNTGPPPNPPGPSVPWQLAIGSSDYDAPQGIAVDYLGNVFITLAFNGNQVDIGDETLDGANGHVLLAKFGPDGEFQWARQIDGTSTGPTHLGTDGSGNVAMSGMFYGTLSLGQATVVNNTGAEHVFVAEYSANGDVLWTGHDSAEYETFPIAGVTGGPGTTVVTGFLQVAAQFGNIEMKVSGLDYFAVAYDASGRVQFADHTTGASTAVGRATAVDDDGNVLIAGRFSSPSTFGNFDLTSAGGFDMFILKYSPAGEILWAKKLGGNLNDSVASMAVDHDGNVLIGGLIADGPTGIWKLDPAGDVVRQIEAPYFYSMTVDASNNVLATGSWVGTITIAGQTLTSNGLADAVMAAYNSSGTALWALSATGPGTNRASGVAVAPDGTPAVIGYFSDELTFGETTLTSNGGKDVFVLHLDSP